MSTTAQDARISRIIVIVLLLAFPVAVGAWLLIWAAIRVGHDIPYCHHNCPPGGRYAPVPASGIVLNVILGIMLVPVLRLLGVGVALGLGPFAAVLGWHAAIADGRLSAAEASGEIGFWRVIAIVAAALAVIGLLMELRLPGPVWRLFGWVPATARLRDYTGPPNATAVIVFTDRAGKLRQKVVPVHENWLRVPVRAWYLATDPSRVRVAPAPLAWP